MLLRQACGASKTRCSQGSPQVKARTFSARSAWSARLRRAFPSSLTRLSTSLHPRFQHRISRARWESLRPEVRLPPKARRSRALQRLRHLNPWFTFPASRSEPSPAAAKGRRRPLDCGEHRRSLPARSAIPVAAFARMQTGPPGLRNSHEFRYTSDAKGSRRPLDCGEHRRSLPARSAVPVAAFARMQTARQGFGTLTSSATALTPRKAGGPWTAASIAALSRRGAPSP